MSRRHFRLIALERRVRARILLILAGLLNSTVADGHWPTGIFSAVRWRVKVVARHPSHGGAAS
jgi:hypothetical protein